MEENVASCRVGWNDDAKGLRDRVGMSGDVGLTEFSLSVVLSVDTARVPNNSTEDRRFIREANNVDPVCLTSSPNSGSKKEGIFNFTCAARCICELRSSSGIAASLLSSSDIGTSGLSGARFCRSQAA